MSESVSVQLNNYTNKIVQGREQSVLKLNYNLRKHKHKNYKIPYIIFLI